MLLVSLDRAGEECVAGHRAAIDAAVKAGSRPHRLTPARWAPPTTPCSTPCRDHARTEDLLRASGLPWTSLRNGFYAASALHLDSARRTGDIALPADGTRRLDRTRRPRPGRRGRPHRPGAFRRTHPATHRPGGPRLRHRRRDRRPGHGRPFTRTVVSDDAFREQTLEHGAPAPVADLLVSVFAAARNGEFTAVDPTLAELTGRQATTFQSLLEDSWAA
ncbi:SDR family NAD(P)-dependent oxidoreductase [Streptomyces sp. KL116D]|uniref:SDR family NAD(P)-dependent oxidoreductase n=1 Tax=Streptomyces sp. KL116D TaxID=3045152 RepID=UPI003557C449